MVSSSSKKLLKELPSQEKMDEIMCDLKAFGPQATAIMGAAYLEHALEHLLKTTFRPLEQQESDRIFDGRVGGILGTFSAKIRIAHAQGLLHEKVYRSLLLINDIRNVFAHSLHSVDFTHELIAADCQRLAAISSAISAAAGVWKSGGMAAIDIYARIVGLLYRSIRQKAADITNGSEVERAP